MALLPTTSSGLDLELELRQMGSIPLTQVREGAETLLTMDISDDLSSLGLQAGAKPEVPKGAEELAAYYEKQLATTQLVQQRLQEQFQTLTEERMSLEASLQLQTAALQQQLAIAYDKAERALGEAHRSQRQVQEAHAAIEEIVGSVTQLAELLDDSQATQALTTTFEAVAQSTQRTFQAITAARAGAQLALEIQQEVRDACQVSPLLASTSSLAAGRRQTTDTVRQLGGDTVRLQRELEEARKREEDLEAELNAAQLLFTGLEAEVVSLQHDQAQAAAKLQVSQEELIAARAQLVAANQVLVDAESPAAGLVSQGITKLDTHMTSIRDFLESLSMPQPAVDVLAGAGGVQEQRAAAQRHSSPDRPASAPPVPVRPAAAASRASTMDSAALGSTHLQGRVVALTAERDAARQQLGVLTAKVSSLEERCKESEREARRLQRVLAAAKEQLGAFAAGGADEATAADVPERLAVILSAFDSLSALGGGCAERQHGLGDRADQELEQQPTLSPSGSPGSRLPMPVVTPPSSTAQLRVIRSADTNIAPSASGTPGSSSSQLRGLAETEVVARMLQEERDDAARLLHELGSEQAALAEQVSSLEASRELLESERDQLHARTLELSAQASALAEERGLLLQRVSDLLARIDVLEHEREAMLQEHSRQMGMAAAAGAAGAAAAVAVSALPPSQGRPRAPLADSPGSLASHDAPSTSQPAESAKLALLALGRRAADLEAQLAEVAAEREAAVSRSARLEEQVEVMGSLLQRAADDRAAALRQVERLAARQAAAADGVSASVGCASLSPSALPTASPPQPPPGLLRSYSRRSHNSRLSDSVVMGEELGQFQEPGAPLQEGSRISNMPSNSLSQSFASEAPLAPTRRFTDASEYHTYLLDPTEPLEELVHPSVMLRGGSGGGALGGAPRGPTSAGGSTVCSLLVSKAMFCAQLEAQYDVKLSAALREHQAEVAKLRQAYDDQAAQLQASIAAAAAMQPHAGPPVERINRSTRVSWAGGAVPQGDYDAELLQHIAGLEEKLAALHGLEDRLAAEHAEHRRQLDARHGAEVTALQAGHRADISRLQAKYEDRLAQLRHVLQQSEDAQAAEQRSARDELAALRCQLAELEQLVVGHKAREDDLREELVQQREAHRAAVDELRAAHDARVARLREEHDAEASTQLSQLRLALEQQGDARLACEQAAREEIASLQRRIAVLEEEAAERKRTHMGQVSGLEASFESAMAELRACHGAEVSGLQEQLAELRSNLRRQEELQAAGQQASSEQTASLQRRMADLEEETTQLLRTHQEQLAGCRDSHESELAELLARHEAEILQRDASCEERLSELRHELQQQQDAAAAQRQAASTEAASLRRRIADLEEEAGHLQQQLASLEQSHALQLAEVRADHDAQLSGLRASRDEQLSDLRQALQQQQDAAAAERQAAQDDLSALRSEVAKLSALAAQRQASVDEMSGRLADQEAAHGAAVARHAAELAGHQAGHGEAMSQLRLAIEALEAQLAERQAAVDSLAEELAQQRDAHKSQLAEHDATHEVALAEHQSRHDLEVTGLMLDVARLQEGVHERDATIADLQRQLQLLQSDKEVEEQSLQSLSTTKAWMTEEIRTLQAELRDAKLKLAASLAELASLKSKAGADSDGGVQAFDRCGATAPSKLMASEGVAAPAGNGEPRQRASVVAAPSSADSLASLAAEQLAEAAMQAAVAEMRLEALASADGQCPSATTGGLGLALPPPTAAAATAPADQMVLMMETVALHGELDQLKSKHGLLQSQLEAMADELANAVLAAALAEAELERLQAAGNTPETGVSSHGGTLSTDVASPPLGLGQEAYPGADPLPPDHLGTRPVSPLQQTRQLQQQLQAVTLCVQDLLDEAGIVQSAAGRQKLSTLWPSITTALKIAQNVERNLGHQQQEQQQQQRGAILRRKPESHGMGEWGGEDDELSWARSAYQDAREALEVLRTEAEDLNAWLWRWGSRLREQRDAAQRELSRVQLAAVPDPERAIEALLNGKDAQLCSAEEEITELQSCLQAAHARLMRRDGQVATLQDLLVQLSEQVTMFEGVVVRCEVLSAGLVSKSVRG